MVRNPNKGFIIKGIDIDAEAVKIADNLTTAWRYEEFNPFNNELADADTYDYSHYDAIINCSVEHMTTNSWFNRIPKGKLVCLQSMSLNILNDNIYKIKNPNPSIEVFTSKFPLDKVLYLGEKKFDYELNPFSRYCLIGYK